MQPQSNHTVVDTRPACGKRIPGQAILRAARASAMPRMTPANTNAPSMMTGRKAGGLVAQAAEQQGVSA